jgi:hypothetical protein
VEFWNWIGILQFREVDHEEKNGRARIEARGSVIGARREESDIVAECGFTSRAMLCG